VELKVLDPIYHVFSGQAAVHVGQGKNRWTDITAAGSGNCNPSMRRTVWDFRDNATFASYKHTLPRGRKGDLLRVAGLQQACFDGCRYINAASAQAERDCGVDMLIKMVADLGHAWR